MKRKMFLKGLFSMVSVFSLVLAGMFFSACEAAPEEETVNPVGKLIILQAYGNAVVDEGMNDSSPAGASHSFIELYNISEEDINLEGISLYFANGTRSIEVTEDKAWESIALTGTIPAKGSFLVLGAKHTDLSDTRYTIPDDTGDINDADLQLSRRAFKAALIKGSAELTVQNPFTDNKGKPVSGYIDMAGSANSYEVEDLIFGFETFPARNSASAAIRRQNLLDTDDNSADFVEARYAADGFTKEELEVRKPRNSSAGAWDPFAEPEPVDTSGTDYTKLVLNEVNGVKFQKWFEIYNTGDVEINLEGVKAYYDNAKGYKLSWTFTEDDVIPAKGYFATEIAVEGVDLLNTGLSANNPDVKLQLRDPNEEVLDTYEKTAGYEALEGTPLRDKAHARIPDGTGDWYFLNNDAGTHNASNGTLTAGYTKFGDE